MSSHAFYFEGGETLAKMGASWFVSYAYYWYVDKTSKHWEKVSTTATRKSRFIYSTEYHSLWLRQVLQMNDNNLNKNTIGLTAKQVKEMARATLQVLESDQ